MIWKLLNDGENSGGFNMKTDMDIAENLSPDEAVLRLYRWKPYCISLGANQNKNEIDFKKTEEAGIDVVTRPTGGRAILHAEELTYAVILPLSELSSARGIYRDINLALLEGLKLYDPRLADAGLEENQPNFPDIYKKDPKSTLCFAVSAKSELKYDGKKLAGSAQRKLGNVILQHGSILCGAYHKSIVNYLNVKDELRESLKGEMEHTTTELSSVLNNDIDYDALSDSVRQGFEKFFRISFAEFIRYSEQLSN